MHQNLFRTLSEEWERTSTTPAARRTLLRWANKDSRFAGAHSPGSVVEEIQRRGNPARSCMLLGALLERADDALAARSVLQAILPGLASAGFGGAPVAHRSGQSDCRQDLDAELISCAWEEIRRHAGTSPAFPARVLVDATRRRMRTLADAARRRADRTVAFDPDQHAPSADLEWTRAPAERLAAHLVDVVRAGRLPAFEARLVFATSVVGLPANEVGRMAGLEPRAVYFALSKAEAALLRACA